MKKIYLYISILMSVACSCSSGDDLDDITMSKDYISVTQSVDIPGDGGEAQLQVNASCSWSISSNAEWLTIEPTSGENNASITVSAGKNTTGSTRTATLTVKGGTSLTRTVTINQARASAQEPGHDDNIPPSTE